MSVLPILTGADNPVLRQKARGVLKVTKEILKLIRDMKDTVANADGVGIAAPQVGTSLRLCLALLNGNMTPLINPEIQWKSAEIAETEEGCLSLPGTNVSVPRAIGIVVAYRDARGHERTLRLSDLEARIVQHEVDHLDGVLIVDYARSFVPGHSAPYADVI